LKTGKAFQRREILLKYELRMEMFGEAEYILSTEDKHRVLGDHEALDPSYIMLLYIYSA